MSKSKQLSIETRIVQKEKEIKASEELFKKAKAEAKISPLVKPTLLSELVKEIISTTAKRKDKVEGIACFWMILL